MTTSERPVRAPAPRDPVPTDAAADLADIVLRLQSEGLRLGVTTEGRTGGAGPSDVGMIWVEDVSLTLDTDPARTKASPFELEREESGFAIYERGQRVAAARPQTRPRFYDLTTVDGVPYWQIEVSIVARSMSRSAGTPSRRRAGCPSKCSSNRQTTWM